MNNWTPDRPTKPGKYWLSLHPDKRGDYPASMPVKVNERGDVYAGLLVLPWLLDGAQWLPYVEPPDPFAEGKRLITVTLTVEERQTLSSALNLVAQSVREMPWDRPEDGDRARELAGKMEALNTRLCEVPQ